MFSWFDSVYPSQQKPGKALSFTAATGNYGNTASPKGVLVQVFNALPPGVNITVNDTLTGLTCGLVGAKTYKLPALAILGFKKFSVKLPAAEALGNYEFLIVTDSECKMGSAPTATWGYYSVIDGEMSDLVYVNNDATGTFTPWAEGMEPVTAVKGQPFTVTVTVKSNGLGEVPAGVVLAAAANGPRFSTACANLTFDKSVTLPKLPSKKKYDAVFEGLVFTGNEERTAFLHLCAIWPGENVTGLDSFFLYYTASPAPMALISAVDITKTTIWSEMKPAPKRPKAGKTMSIGFNVINTGSIDGVIGAAGLWIVPYTRDPDDDYYYSFNAVNGTKCNYTSPLVTATSDATLKVGKTKWVKFTDVPVPATPGAYVAAAQFDTACANAWPWTGLNRAFASWNVFIVG
ncbi:MAG: hypothetical protein J3K34DRAFT_423537 [Monoraphidium minutum]|nr:MAG: hypothetical protein J3K34DRAFT_423537 [Monoraphidium minutum]